MTDQQLRQYARLGALDEALKAVRAFPDILPEVNRLAKGVNGARRDGVLVAARIEEHVVPALRASRRKRTLSAAGRRAISRAQKARWRKLKAERAA